MNDKSLVPYSFHYAIYATLFLAIFYNTITNMAGIYIASDLGGGLHMSVYPMVFFGLGNLFSIPLSNPLADRFGSIKVLFWSLVLFSVFSVLCGLSPTFFILNVMRFFMGFSCGFFYVLCRRLIFFTTEGEKQKKYSFFMLLMYATVPVIGACVGATLAYENLWKWIFHINLPISLLLAWYFWLQIPFCMEEKKEFSMDIISYICFTIALSCIVIALTLSQQLDWYRSPFLVTLTFIGIPNLIYFLGRTLLGNQPIISLHLLKNKQLSFALVNLGTLFSSYFGMIILIALWLSFYVNYTPWWITLLLATMGLSGVIAFILSRGFFSKIDPRFTLAFAISSFALSCYISTYFDVDVDFFHLAIARFLAGLGLVMFMLPLFKIAQSSLDKIYSDQIFILFQVTRALFSSLGAALYVVLWQRRQVFFYERLGEGLTINSQLTMNFYSQAEKIFHLTPLQSTAQLEVFLDQQSTSLALNDVFGFMGYILVFLLFLLILSFFVKRKINAA